MVAVGYKVVILGESGVGKSSLISRLIRNKFFVHPDATTTGAAYHAYTVDTGDGRVKLEIWDTAGQERFRSLMPLYYRDAAAAILVYDVSKPSSYECLTHWLGELREKTSNLGVLVLVGNKSDLPTHSAMSTITIDAEMLGARHFCTSAKDGRGVDALFTHVATAVARNPIGARFNHQSQLPSTSAASKCCG